MSWNKIEDWSREGGKVIVGVLILSWGGNLIGLGWEKEWWGEDLL